MTKVFISSAVISAILISPLAVSAESKEVNKLTKQHSGRSLKHADYVRKLQSNNEHAMGMYTLDGYGNNQHNPVQGASGEIYRRVAPADYADGIAGLVDAP